MLRRAVKEHALRPKKDTIISSSRYPPLTHSDDNVDASDSIDALNIELEKPKPRKDVVLSLMKSTYYPRRTFILNDPGTVSNKVTKYSAFMMPSVVSE